MPDTSADFDRPARLTLVLGGARSGKSRLAESLVTASGLAPVYLATATADDAEMSERIDRHRRRRGTGWKTIEEPLELAPTLTATAAPERAVLVDCLTLWLSNLMAAGRDPESERERLVAAAAAAAGPIVFVANEVGHGIVPENALARAFRDNAGLLHQALADEADQVVFVAAGLPLVLKPAGPRPAVPGVPAALDPAIGARR